ncbi:MAG: hypothetical protein GY861_19160 [bacterium]|nr:hypothetical protein [bacterium]
MSRTILFSGEVWKDIAGYEGLYQVSNKGRVKRTSTRRWSGQVWYDCEERIRKPVITKRGYYAVMLYKDNKHKGKNIHTLLLETFVSKRPLGMQCRHLDGNPLNNNLDNLAWGTVKENMADAICHGTTTWGEKNRHAKLKVEEVLLIRKILKANIVYNMIIAKMFKISKSTVSSIKHKTSWCYLKEENEEQDNIV